MNEKRLGDGTMSARTRRFFYGAGAPALRWLEGEDWTSVGRELPCAVVRQTAGHDQGT
ncbi:hypothetical protein HW511_13415 [Asaia siamensis]|uniref:hypothetical protein n=1 Tax=Asaia siamensis TaxID=110479 RepID=UPI00166B5D51|nr:hypothetical protein [Asaia siamensis]